ncbi:MAG: hypothetical protein ACK6EB_17820, partial [Planctomyces sp.]
MSRPAEICIRPAPSCRGLYALSLQTAAGRPETGFGDHRRPRPISVRCTGHVTEHIPAGHFCARDFP